jgi:transposase
MAEGRKERFAGIDLAKRTMEVCVVEDGKKIERHGLKTDCKGLVLLSRLLKESDTVAVEACGFANHLARYLTGEAGCEVSILNPGRLRVIGSSSKKTDREDALKLAKFIQRTPYEELPVVPLITEDEEDLRELVTMSQFLGGQRVAAINRLHALYARVGIIDVTKKDLKTDENRKKRLRELPKAKRDLAEVLLRELVVLEKELGGVKEKLENITRENDLTPYLLSIPGVGIGLASVIIAYLGNGDRFSKASEVANYAGFTPRVDRSGETNHYGHISQKAYCHAIRGVVLQGVWAMSRSSSGGVLKEKFEELSKRMNRRKAAVAVARKIVTLAWLLLKNREFYSGFDKEVLIKKFKFYGVKFYGWESVA